MEEIFYDYDYDYYLLPEYLLGREQLLAWSSCLAGRRSERNATSERQITARHTQLPRLLFRAWCGVENSGDDASSLPPTRLLLLLPGWSRRRSSTKSEQHNDAS